MPKNVKGMTNWDFLTSILLQNIGANIWGPFCAIQKIAKKSHDAEKNLSEKHLDSQSVFSRLWTSVFLYWRGSEV